MSNQNQTPQNFQAQPEGTTEVDPKLSEVAVDEMILRVEGQNENITTPPKEVQADIAATARDLEDSILEIEDGS